MSISASQIVNVIPRTIVAGGTDLEIVGLLLTKNNLCPFPAPKSFTSSTAVGAYFGYDSAEYKAAVKYFLGYDNSFKKPTRLWFGRWATEASKGTYIGTGAVSAVSAFTSITNGKCTWKIDGVTKVCENMSFASVTTQSDIAGVLTAKLSTATVSYDSNLNAYIIRSNTTGTSSTVEFVEDGGQTITTIAKYNLTTAATTAGYTVSESGLTIPSVGLKDWDYVSENWSTLSTNFEVNSSGVVTEYTEGTTTKVCYGTPVASTGIAAMMGLTSGSSWAGAGIQTPSQNMTAIINVEQNWVSFTTIEETTTEQAIAFAEWVNDTSCEYAYFPWTTKIVDVTATATDNLPQQLAEGDYEGVCLTYGNLNHGLLPVSIGACIDWNRNNGLPTYAFKTQSGLAASVDDDATAGTCVDTAVNFYGNYATRNDNFSYYYQGKMSGGKFGFIDAYIGQLWLRNSLQVSIASGLGGVGRVPYNEEGYTIIRAWCSGVLQRALHNGVINTGVSISAAQKAQLYNEIGEDVADQIYANGYYLMVKDPDAAVRAERQSPEIGLWYTYGGSVHKLDVPVTAIL